MQNLRAVPNVDMEQKILLIDDSAILRRIATNVLTARAGCGGVVTATRATEGFARACGSDVGLILVDYQLAGYPQGDLCRRLLDEPRTSRVPVVMLLGRGMAPPASGTLPGNIVDFLVKPFTPDQLVSTVKAVFDAAKSRAPVRRVREQGDTPGPTNKPPLLDRHETVAAVPVATLSQRETARVPPVRATLTTRSSVTTLVPRGADSHRPNELARLHAALQNAVSLKRTGVFSIRTGDAPATELYVENGQIVVVATLEAARYSQDVDGVVPPKVSPAILESAVAEQAQTGVPFILTLGSRGLLSKTTAVTLLHRFGQQHFSRLWTVRPELLTFEFVALDALPGFALRLEPRRESLDEWLLGALRYLQAKDIAVFARHEGFAGTATFRKNGVESMRALGLCEQELEFGQQVEGRRDLATIAKAMGITAEHAFLLLFRFRCLEIMEYRPTASAFVVTPRTSVRRVLPLQR